LKTNIYLFLFLAVFLWVVGYCGFTAIYLKANQDRFTESFTKYVLCNAAMEEDCVNEDPLPIWIVYLQIFNWCSSGTFCLVTFGLQFKILRHWKLLLGHLVRGEFKAITNMSLGAEGRTNTNDGIITVTVGSEQKKLKQKEVMKESYDS